MSTKFAWNFLSIEKFKCNDLWIIFSNISIWVIGIEHVHRTSMYQHLLTWEYDVSGLIFLAFGKYWSNFCVTPT